MCFPACNPSCLSTPVLAVLPVLVPSTLYMNNPKPTAPAAVTATITTMSQLSVYAILARSVCCLSTPTPAALLILVPCIQHIKRSQSTVLLRSLVTATITTMSQLSVFDAVLACSVCCLSTPTPAALLILVPCIQYIKDPNPWFCYGHWSLQPSPL